MKIAIVHDYLNQYGGAERVLEVVHEIWPEAPIYTSLVNFEKMQRQGFKTQGKDLRSSFMQKIPFKRFFANSYFLPLYPLAFERFNLDEYDVVFSITSYAAKGIITKPDTLHVCYCCTPTRHLWNHEEYISLHPNIKKIHKPFLYPIIHYLRLWDMAAAQRVDTFIAISKEVSRRIEKTYHRPSRVIYPPVKLERFLKIEPKKTEKNKGFFLIVSRLGGHKRVDLAIQAFNLLGLPLKIIGEGSKLKEYKKMAKSNIEFLGRLPDMEVDSYYQHCLAFIYPQEEDFGITALEAQAAGKPVVAYRKGGALETIRENETGVFFHPQTPEALAQAVKVFLDLEWDVKTCRQNALQFSEERFKKEIKEAVENIYSQRLI
jgi:glycosyltransferase involved in cell wall biosynthesis